MDEQELVELQQWTESAMRNLKNITKTVQKALGKKRGANYPTQYAKGWSDLN